MPPHTASSSSGALQRGASKDDITLPFTSSGKAVRSRSFDAHIILAKEEVEPVFTKTAVKGTIPYWIQRSALEDASEGWDHKRERNEIRSL